MSDDEHAVSIGHAWPVQAQDVRHAPSRRVVRVARGDVHVEGLAPHRLDQFAIVRRRDADEDAGGATDQAIRGLPGVFKRLPRDLEDKALLGIHRARLARRDPEEARIEAVDVLQEAAVVLGRHASWLGQSRPRLCVPAVGGNLGDRVDAVAQQRPVRLGRRGAAGEPACQADDRDGLPAPRFQRIDTGLKPLDGIERLLEECAAVGTGDAHRILPNCAASNAASSSSDISSRSPATASGWTEADIPTGTGLAAAAGSSTCSKR